MTKPLCKRVLEFLALLSRHLDIQKTVFDQFFFICANRNLFGRNVTENVTKSFR